MPQDRHLAGNRRAESTLRDRQRCVSHLSLCWKVHSGWSKDDSPPEQLLCAGKDQAKIDEIGDAIIELCGKRQEILTIAASKVELQERINTLISFLEE